MKKRFADYHKEILSRYPSDPTRTWPDDGWIRIEAILNMLNDLAAENEELKERVEKLEKRLSNPIINPMSV